MMSKLTGFIKLLEGHFDNQRQFEEKKRQGIDFPYAKHINTICNDKIDHLGQEFDGIFLLEESYYTTNGKTHASAHLFLFPPGSRPASCPFSFCAGRAGGGCWLPRLSAFLPRNEKSESMCFRSFFICLAAAKPAISCRMPLRSPLRRPAPAGKRAGRSGLRQTDLPPRCPRIQTA